MPPISRSTRVQEIISSNVLPEDTIRALKNKIIIVPAWGTLEKEYDPMKHPVMNRKEYRDKLKHGRTERMTRITYAVQKLAVKRMKELMFTIPVKRKYTTNTEEEKRAANIMEAIFKKNHVDAMNIKRSHKLFASCEMVTIWYAQMQPTNYGGEDSPLKLRAKTYSPMDGDAIYPLFDEYDDLVALSIEYTRYISEEMVSVTYFDTYTDTQHLRWARRNGGWAQDIEPEPINIGKIQGVYIHRDTPIWEDQSENGYELEWCLSRNGNYLRKNSRPTWVIYSDAARPKSAKGEPAGDDNAGRNILRYGKDDKAGYATWPQAIDALKFHTDEIRRNIHTTLQLPDMSMEQMKATPMSGEARKMLFIDCQMKVTDESGDWLEFFDREVNVVRAFCKVMYPKLASAFDTLGVENIITAYRINSLSDDIKDATNATGGKAVASRKTMVRRLGLVPEEEVDAEIEEIDTEETQTADAFAQEPSM